MEDSDITYEFVQIGLSHKNLGNLRDITYGDY
jgi:hypothetical protein